MTAVPRSAAGPHPGHRSGPGAAPDGRLRLLLVCGVAAAAVTVSGVGTEALATTTAAGQDGETGARQLLSAAAASLGQPHVGRVSIVTFSSAGPRVADLDVHVDAMGTVELRRPTRWLLGGPTDSWLRTVTGAAAVAPASRGSRLEVDAVLQRWDATVGAPRELDTGTATPVHLVRRSGAAIEEVVYVDEATSIPVRRETRDADGAVLRVVAYTSLSLLDGSSPAALRPTTMTGAGPGPPDLHALAEDGYEVPASLEAGFHLLSAGHRQGMVVARYGDGLSVLSVYQQHGRLDPSDLDGATVEVVAGRHVWAWPGREPLRLVWTGGDRTWTAVSDAPLEVVEDAIGSLPGDRVGHDVPSRISRGMARAVDWLRDLVPW